MWPYDVDRPPIEIASTNAPQDRVRHDGLDHETITLNLGAWVDPDNPEAADATDDQEVMMKLVPYLRQFGRTRLFYVSYAAEARTSRSLAPWQDIDVTTSSAKAVKDRFIQRLLRAINRLAGDCPEFFESTEIACISFGADALMSCMQLAHFWTRTLPRLRKTLTVSSTPGHALPFTKVFKVLRRVWATFDFDLLSSLGKWCTVTQHPDHLVSNAGRGTIFKRSPNPHLQAILIYFRIQYWKITKALQARQMQVIAYSLGGSFVGTRSRGVPEELAEDHRICSDVVNHIDEADPVLDWSRSGDNDEAFSCSVCTSRIT